MTSCNQGLSQSDQERQWEENHELGLYLFNGDKKFYILTIAFGPFSDLHWSQRRKTLQKKTPVETYVKVIRSLDSDVIGQVLKIIQRNMHVSTCEPLFVNHLCVITFKVSIKL